MTEGEDDQLSLLPPPARARAEARKAKPPREKKPLVPAEVDPVARVLVDVPLAHLDRPFDYAVPETMSEQAQPGVRVKVRFAGQLVDGYVIERVPTSERVAPLQPLRRVVSAEPVLAADVADLTAQVAARYAGTRSDVLRLAVPPRHATTEKQPSEPAPAHCREPPAGVRLRVRRRRGAARGAGTGRVPAGRVDGAARRRLAGPARRGRGRGRCRRARRAGLRSRPPRRGPARRRPDQPVGGGPSRRAQR